MKETNCLLLLHINIVIASECKSYITVQYISIYCNTLTGLSTGEGSQGSNAQSCSVHLCVADRGCAIDGGSSGYNNSGYRVWRLSCSLLKTFRVHFEKE